MSEDKDVNVGIVGYGVAGEIFHAPVIHIVSGLKIKTVVERNNEKSRQKYPWVKVVKDIGELLNDPLIDLVVIATPNGLHYEMAYQSLMAGKHVVVDKPFTISVEEADRLIELAEKKDRLLSVYHNRRWAGDFRTAKKIFQDGLLGDVLEYEAHFDRFRPTLKLNAWREKNIRGAGILYDLGSHLIDQALVLFGLPEKVSADIQLQRLHVEADDYFEVILHYKNHRAILKASMLVENPGPHLVIKGTKGTYTKYTMDPQEEMLRKGIEPSGQDWGVDAKEHWGILHTNEKDIFWETMRGDYPAYYKNIYEAITGKNILHVEARQAREVIRIIELARLSSDTKQLIEVA